MSLKYRVNKLEKASPSDNIASNTISYMTFEDDNKKHDCQLNGEAVDSYEKALALLKGRGIPKDDVLEIVINIMEMPEPK